jgi:hypothetical protein
MPRYAPLACFAVFLIMSNTGGLAAQTDAVQQKPVPTGNIGAPAAVPVKKNYDEDAKSWYAVYNTGNIIHIYLAVTDPMQQRKIVTNGMELWIDAKGKKNKTTGILFPVITHAANEKPMQGPPPGFNGNGPGSFDNHNGPDTNNIQALEKNIALQREMKLTGFKQELNGLQNIHHPSGIQVSLYFIKDTLVYDAQLPVNTLSEPLSVNSHISVCFIEKGMAMPDFGGNQMPPPDGGGDGMMPPPGGGGGPGPGGEDRMRMFQDDIIWYKFSLLNTGIQ